MDVARAAAEISGNRLTDLHLGWIRVTGQELKSGDQHARSTVATLQPMVIPEGLLERVKRSRLAQPLNRDDAAPVGLDCQHQACARRVAIDEDGAGTADALLTTHPDAGKTDSVTQKI